MTVDLKIDHIGSAGDGIAYHENRPVYIPYTAPGDEVTVELGETRGNGVVGQMTDLKSAGPDRTEPLCRHFGTCGGCSLQHLSAEFNLAWKRQRIVDCLAREGLQTVQVEETVASPPQSRRRVEFIASKRKKGVMVGFHLRKSDQIFDTGDCPVLRPELTALLQPLRLMLPAILPRRSEARIMATSTNGSIDLQITANIDPDLEAREVLAAFAADNNLSRLSVRPKPGQPAEVIAAITGAEITIGGYDTLLSPGGFLQATAEGERVLTDRAATALTDAKTIVDLFAGCGSFTFPLVGWAKVHAVEEDEELVSTLQKSANRNILPVTSERRDLFRRPLLAGELNRFEGLVFDPPRAGAAAQVEEIAKSEVATVVAVSCNPVSFARDIAVLVNDGYEVKSVLPVDQFLWSPHVEMIAELHKS